MSEQNQDKSSTVSTDGTKTDYPKYDLKTALDIAQAIVDSYSGKPIPPKSLAEACGSSHGSGTWRTKLAAARAYGLVQGSYGAKKVRLTERAESIFSPRSGEEKAQALQGAAREPELFRRVYEHFDKGGFPEDDFFDNILTRDFDVPADDVDRFKGILEANAAYAYGGASLPDESPDAETDAAQGEEERAAEQEEQATPLGAASQVPKAITAPGREARVFIGHSQNEAILGILGQTMEIAGLEWEIAEQEETVALPVPEKVFEAMHRCTAAVINISADEQERQEDGSYRVNQNVLIEIGAAFVLYDRDVVLVWDERVQVPSNLQGLYLCKYEGNELAANDLLRLQQAIADFRHADHRLKADTEE